MVILFPVQFLIPNLKFTRAISHLTLLFHSVFCGVVLLTVQLYTVRQKKLHRFIVAIALSELHLL